MSFWVLAGGSASWRACPASTAPESASTRIHALVGARALSAPAAVTAASPTTATIPAHRDAAARRRSNMGAQGKPRLRPGGGPPVTLDSRIPPPGEEPRKNGQL